VVPFFGKAVGGVVNFAPERSVRYDLEGQAVEILKGAYQQGEGYLQVGRERGFLTPLNWYGRLELELARGNGSGGE
jgi:hypothetical protein